MMALLLLIGLIALAFISYYASIYVEQKKSLKGETVNKDTGAATAWGIFIGISLLLCLLIPIFK